MTKLRPTYNLVLTLTLSTNFSNITTSLSLDIAYKSRAKSSVLMRLSLSCTCYERRKVNIIDFISDIPKKLNTILSKHVLNLTIYSTNGPNLKDFSLYLHKSYIKLSIFSKNYEMSISSCNLPEASSIPQ